MNRIIKWIRSLFNNNTKAEAEANKLERKNIDTFKYYWNRDFKGRSAIADKRIKFNQKEVFNQSVYKGDSQTCYHEDTERERRIKVCSEIQKDQAIHGEWVANGSII